MKTKLLITVALFFGYIAIAQDKLVFSYDTAGNQILRNRVCLTCLQAVMPSTLDSIPIAEEEASLDEFGTFKMVAYPNPVTDILYVEWEDHPDKKPNQILLFTLDGRKVMDTPLSGKYGSYGVEFNRHPPGAYLLLVIYESGKKESFKIIKN
jgi:hypothetical protein